MWSSTTVYVAPLSVESFIFPKPSILPGTTSRPEILIILPVVKFGVTGISSTLLVPPP